MIVRLLPEAKAELDKLPPAEAVAMSRVILKLAELGTDLLFPHHSGVRGSAGLRELRPRAGRSPWRALYRRVGDAFVVAAIGPEAKVDRRSFNSAVQVAGERLVAYVEREGGTV
ncbi:MAG: hypothetical protein HW416_3268 [Chloroflexi bacterium]|nr:hypothetical protein [Chloroflexota bacterium]